MARHKVEDLSDRQLNHIRRFAGLPRLHAKEMTSWRGFLRWHGYWIREGPYSDEAAAELLEEPPFAPEPWRILAHSATLGHTSAWMNEGATPEQG